VTQEAFDIGCTCHCGAPPCSFCTGMAEEECDAYVAGGRAALIPFIGRMSNEDYHEILEKVDEGQDQREAC
jgi:hypothetical protein